MSVAPPKLTADDIVVEIGGRRILHGCSLSAVGGEFVVLAGPNGAGKSTLLRALAGLLPFTGRVTVAGDDQAKITSAERSRRIAFLPQGGAIHWPMPVRDVVALGRMPFAASLQKLSPQDLAAVDKAMADCDIEALAEMPATELSGGELSRVLLARVLATQAPVLLLDEPAASLDPAHQSAVMRLLRAIADKGGLVIAVSHDLAQAARYATRIVLMSDGAIVADSQPPDLFASGAIERIFGMRFHSLDIDGEAAFAMTPLRN